MSHVTWRPEHNVVVAVVTGGEVSILRRIWRSRVLRRVTFGAWSESFTGPRGDRTDCRSARLANHALTSGDPSDCAPSQVVEVAVQGHCRWLVVAFLV